MMLRKNPETIQQAGETNCFMLRQDGGVADQRRAAERRLHYRMQSSARRT